MSSRKIDDSKKQAIAVTANIKEWIKVEEAAVMLGVTKETIENNIRDHLYPEYAYRQSLISRVWWLWVPAVIGFTADEWQNKTA